MRTRQQIGMPAVLATALLVLQSSPRVHAARLESGSLRGWLAYVAAAEVRMSRELNTPGRFLGLDFAQDATSDRQAVLSGEVVIRKLQAVSADGTPIEVPSARVHHWRGVVFMAGVTVASLMDQLQQAPPTGQEDVLASRVLERGPAWMKVYLKLQRRKLVTVVYDTEHVVTFRRYGPTRASSISVATKIAELQDPGTPDERERPQGDDQGFLWKLNAYWRYDEVPGGVVAECGSISLSRDVPAVLRYVIEPLIDSTARESMDRTLNALRERFAAATRS